MLTNTQIHTLLLENKGDMTAFQNYVGFKSRQAMEFRLASEEPKNNLFGKYIEFLVKNRKVDTLMNVVDVMFENLGISHLLKTEEEQKIQLDVGGEWKIVSDEEFELLGFRK